MHNVLLSQELLQGYNRANLSPRCILKIDLKKAYDSLSWKFLFRLLEALKFPSCFVNWITTCVTSTTYSLVINGENVCYIKGKRGLRQGDPLSPYLLVIGMEDFSGIMRRKARDKCFNWHPRCRST